MPLSAQLHDILIKKNIDPKLYLESSIQPGDSVDKIAADLYSYVYSRPYHKDAKGEDPLERYHHGIQHVSRVAHYVPILANLYRRQGDVEALALNNEDLKLLQIAALFHDAARENEDKDYWDKESGFLLFCYLVDILKVSPEKAAQLAEAVANKDVENNVYYSLVKNLQGEFEWCDSKAPPKNIFQKLIHDADCLDIMRARDLFDANFLDFYQAYGKDQPAAFEEMVTFIIEARRLIEQQGDGRKTHSPALKLIYNTKEGFLTTLESMKEAAYPLLSTLHGDAKLLSAQVLQQKLLDDTPYNPNSALSEKNLRAALREGKVFARSVIMPSSIRHKEGKAVEETRGGLEIRKTYRRLGTATQTLKDDRRLKHGNPDRSISLIGWGAAVYGSAGFLIVNPKLEKFSDIREVDADTGRYKKKHLRKNRPQTSAAANKILLDQVLKKQKMGGGGKYLGREFLAHTEMVYPITEFNAIYFSDEANASILNSGKPAPFSPALQALYLQKKHEQLTGNVLPIFRYSAVNDSVKEVTYTPDEIKEMWLAMCSARFSGLSFDSLSEYSLDKLLAYSLYKEEPVSYEGRRSAMDMVILMESKDEFEVFVEKMRRDTIEQRVAFCQNSIKLKNASLFDPEVFSVLMKIDEKVLDPETKEIAHTDIKAIGQSVDYFKKIPSIDNLFTFVRPFILSKRYDPQRLLKESQRYNRTNILKAYLLASKLGFANEAQAIQKIALQYVQSNLKKVAPSSESGKLNDRNFIALMNLIVAFDLYPQFEGEVKKMVVQAFENMKKAPLWNTHFIEYCVKQGFTFTSRMKAIGKPFFQECERDVLRFDPMNTHLEKYLHLAPVFAPLEKQRQIVQQSLLKSGINVDKYFRKKFINKLIELGWPNYQPLFQALISGIREKSVADFDRAIEFLKTQLPSRQFYAKQLAIIQQQRELYETFYSGSATKYFDICAKTGTPPHIVLFGAGKPAISDFCDKLINEGLLSAVLSSRNKDTITANKLILSKMRDQLDHYKSSQDSEKVIAEYYSSFKPSSQRGFLTFWKKDCTTDCYLVLLAVIAHKQKTLTAKGFYTFLDNLGSNSIVKTLPDKKFQQMLSDLRDLYKSEVLENKGLA